MLKIINDLSPFFEDCYRRINVREYARLLKISPPTASKVLAEFEKEGLLKKNEDRNYFFFYANKESKFFTDLSRIYWSYKLREFVSFLEDKLVNPTIILYGSLSKAETKPESDIDIAVISTEEIDAKKFEKKLGREFQILFFDSFNKIKSPELKDNILNGYILAGKIEI
jgi:predicted nucleotidyltransferase